MQISFYQIHFEANFREDMKIASGTLSFRYRAPFDQQLIPFGIKLQAESSTSYKPYANEVGVNIEE